MEMKKDPEAGNRLKYQGAMDEADISIVSAHASTYGLLSSNLQSRD